MPVGHIESRKLTGESYKLAFTPDLIHDVYQRTHRDGECENLLPDPLQVFGVDPVDSAADRGGYVDINNDKHWWIPSGRMFLSPDSKDSPEQELEFALKHFFLPRRQRDPFHTDAVSTETTVTYDAYDLLVAETCDALGNKVTAGVRDTDGQLIKSGNDYRVLQPSLVMDANRNRSEVAFDALGMVVGTAVMGKPEGDHIGDSLDGFVADLDEAELQQHLANPHEDPHAILGNATSRLAYDLFAFQRTADEDSPLAPVVYTITRETHASEIADGEQSKVQLSFTYSDGFGREVQKKVQAEPGPALVRDDESGDFLLNERRQQQFNGAKTCQHRWVSTGWTIYNNKGKPVRQFEPFFSDNHRFESEVCVGVSPVLFYDPVERVVATIHPNQTFEKVVFDAWKQATWDVNDTVLIDPRNDSDVSGFVTQYIESQNNCDLARGSERRRVWATGTGSC